ncbi:lipoma HMGIC fusion partner-like 3 protein [Elysia marginata]|uniref:Lipoma HMGIC fusion partner-like 3 protein n=1 Tax=Elysia marginata TaxID=1093978 RepID=A0AAV4FXL5_9GAST|nr:lipoma HMGIC fusion partner-like 3 protein [Elysia marginata]
MREPESRETQYQSNMTKIRHTNYVRNSRAVVVLWAFFTIVFLILNIVVFIQPQWIGDSGESAVAGFFGLYRRCEEMAIEDDFVCTGDFFDFSTILNSYFKACAVLVGVSCLLFIVCVGCFFLFLVLNTATVLQTCAWFQLLSGILMLISCILYPAGWDDAGVQVVCGLQADKFDLGVCDIRWGFILAIVLVFDAFILSILAFVLAAKQANLLPEVYKDSDKEPIKY